MSTSVLVNVDREVIFLYISGRERKIIELLLTQDDGATIQTLAQSLDVSGRTIHRDLKSVEDVLQKYQLRLNKKSGVGVKIEGNKDNKKRLNTSLTNVEYTDYTPEERQAIILATLLETSEPIKLFTLADELNVTIATVSNDLDKIHHMLNAYQLTLIRKRGYGVKVDGDETNKRSALSYLISKYIDELDFLLFIKENIEKKTKQPIDSISERLLGLVDQSKLVTIEKSIERTREDLPYEIADSSYIGLVVHLALAVERLQQGDTIRFDPTYLNEIKNSQEYDTAKQIINELEQAFDMNIPEDEIGYITMHLLGAKIRSDHEYLLEDSSIDIALQAKELIQYVGNQLHVDLNGNTHLFHDLITHLKPTVYRIQKGMHIKNPLLEEVRTDYQQLFSIIKAGCEQIFPSLAFPEEEIAYLVLHFAAATIRRDEQSHLTALVICSSGIGTSKMLASRLSQEIVEIEKIDNRSLFELQNIELNEYDLVISTIPLKDMVQDYTLVSPILTEDEIEKIKAIVKQKRLRAPKKVTVTPSLDEQVSQEQILARLKRMQIYSALVLELLRSFHVVEVKKQRTKIEVLQLACQDLQKTQQIPTSNELLEALLNREKLGGLGIPHTSMALFHTRHDSIKKPSFTIYALDYPIEVKGMDNQSMQIETVLFMLSPVQAQEETLEILSYISGLMIKDHSSISLFQSKDQTKISTFIAHHLNTFINEKLS